MKYLLLIFSFFIITSLLAESSNKERLDIILSKGINAFESNLCLTDEGAITYFEEYINLGGNRDGVLKYLAYCKIQVGLDDPKEIDALKDGINFLTEVFEKDNQNLEILKLLLGLYIKTNQLQRAKTYAILINEEKNIDNDFYLLIARLYFNGKEYNKVINYALKYKIKTRNKNMEVEKLFMIAYSYFKLNKNINSKIYFNNLLKIKTINKNYKRLSVEVLKTINKNENFGKYSNFYNITLTNGIVFDSNVISQPSFSAKKLENNNFPGLPNLENELPTDNIKNIGLRDENYLSLYLYPLNLNKHAIIFNINNFTALHYPKTMANTFNPQEYDIFNVSGILGYEFHNYYTKTNILKLFFYIGYKKDWLNILNSFNFYSKSINTGFNISYNFENNINIGIYSKLNFDTYDNNIYEPKINSQTGKYFNSIISAYLPITSSFILFLSSGYIGSRTIGNLYNYNGFSSSGGLFFKIFSFLELSSNISYEKKAYLNESRNDNLISLGVNINFIIKDTFSINISYNYNLNNSSLDMFSYDKHLLGIYFNFIM